jgi:branched-chain amino acid transport system permease protein
MSDKVTIATSYSRITTAGLVAIILLAAAAPFFVGRGTIQDLFFILTMLTLAQLWNLLAGYGGLVSVGQQAFVGLGAYAMFAGVILLDMDPILAIPLGGIIAVAFALPAGLLAFRLQGAYFAIGTWVIAEVARLLVAQWKALGGGTGTSLPRAATSDIIGVDAISALLGVREAAARDILAYWLALLLAVITIGGIYWLLRNKLGLALSAVRDNAEAARTVGVDASRMQWAVYLIAAFGTGLVGALIFVQTARISPDAAFNVLDWTAFVIFIVVIGGIGTLEGPIIGILIFWLLRTLFADYGSIYLIMLGLIGIIVMLVAPRGLWGLFSSRTGIALFPIRRNVSIEVTGEGDGKNN